MRATVMIWAGITVLILFAASAFFMNTIMNTTLWAAMCNTSFENGVLAIAIPFAMLGFGGAIIYALFKGPESIFRIGREQ